MVRRLAAVLLLLAAGCAGGPPPEPGPSPGCIRSLNRLFGCDYLTGPPASVASERASVAAAQSARS